MVGNLNVAVHMIRTQDGNRFQLDIAFGGKMVINLCARQREKRDL